MVTELPQTCCMNIAKTGSFKSCNKQATNWYRHHDDVCSYCDEHDYVCGIPIHNPKEAS